MQLFSCYCVEDKEKKEEYEVKKGIKLEHNLWHQPETNTYFSIDTCLRHDSGPKVGFYLDKGEFLKSNRSSSSICSTEYVYQFNEKIASFTGSKILIVGAGISTDLIDWNPSNYDFIFSCNKFYQNEKLYNTKVSAITVGELLNVYDSNFIAYLEKHNPLIIIEPDHLTQKQLSLRQSLKHYDKIVAKVRYNGRIGVVPRLILYGIFWGASEIHIVGMDGIPNRPTTQIYHAFEKHQKPLDGSIETHSKNHADIVLNYQLQYVLFWDYVFSLSQSKNIQFVNLGEEIPDNMLAEVSRKLF